jgi:microcystin degradation protein MlrC
MSKRVLFAGLVHETHTFVPGFSRLSDFEVMRGEEIWRADGDTSTVAGGLAIAKECGWDVVPVIEIIGGAGPLVHDDVVDVFWHAFEPVALREVATGLDGIWLNLHGAGVSQSLLDIEGELLRRIRALPGFDGVPICSVFDPHGNCTQAMCDFGTAMVAYRKNPHSDGKAAAMDSARILDRLMRSGETCVTVWERPLIVVPPTATGTAVEPFVSIEAAAREIEHAYPEILSVNVFLGFAYADMPDVGVSFSACTVGDPDVARVQLKKLSAMILANKQYALPQGLSVDEAIARLDGKGLTVLIEQSDNIGGGSPGDLTHVLAALMRHSEQGSVQNAGVVINDPEAVQLLSQLPMGARTRLSIGGKSGGIGAEPIALELELISTSEGKFEVEDPHSHAAVNGRNINMGPCALVKSGGVTILLTSNATAPMDLGQWRSQGINPEQFSVVVVKAAVAHKQAYDPITTTSWVLNTPGPCTADVRSLPFKHAKRPLYPLEEI